MGNVAYERECVWCSTCVCAGVTGCAIAGLRPWDSLEGAKKITVVVNDALRHLACTKAPVRQRRVRMRGAVTPVWRRVGQCGVGQCGVGMPGKIGQGCVGKRCVRLVVVNRVE